MIYNKWRKFFLMGILSLLLLGPGWIASASVKPHVTVKKSYKSKNTKGHRPNYNAKRQIQNYAKLAHQTYQETHLLSYELLQAVEVLLKNPTEETLSQAKSAWVNARFVYGQTEVFRFYGGPIDYVDPVRGWKGPEFLLNPWPINESFIDYVEGEPDSGIINDFSFPFDERSLLKFVHVTTETNPITGWHVIKFLLWGQDSHTGPGRPSQDFLPGEKRTDRRRLFLFTITKLLVNHLSSLEYAWRPGQPENYVLEFLRLPQEEALGRILTGLVNLTGYEMVSENNRADLLANILGVRNIYFGDYQDFSGPGLSTLIQPLFLTLQAKILISLKAAESIIRNPKNNPERSSIKRAIPHLKKFAESLIQAGQFLGVKATLKK